MIDTAKLDGLEHQLLNRHFDGLAPELIEVIGLARLVLAAQVARGEVEAEFAILVEELRAVVKEWKLQEFWGENGLPPELKELSEEHARSYLTARRIGHQQTIFIIASRLFDKGWPASLHRPVEARAVMEDRERIKRLGLSAARLIEAIDHAEDASEREAVARNSPPEPVSHPDQSWCDAYASWYEGRLGDDDCASLRVALATAERERDEARSTNAKMREALERDDLSAKDELAKAIGEWGVYGKQLHDATVAAEARAASLEGLLTEAGKALGDMAAIATLFPHSVDNALVTVTMSACRRARSLLTRIEAREGGEDGAIAGKEKGRG